MACNIELKAHLHDFGRQYRLVEQLCDLQPQQISQVDTYFRVNRGRLKLREFTDGSCELIQYAREDTSTPVPSHYHRIPLTDPAAVKAALIAALGVRGVISKTRTLFLQGQTRIHLDRVEGLGDFIELEVVLHSDQSEETGAATATALMTKLEIAPEQLVKYSYIDLLDVAKQLPALPQDQLQGPRGKQGEVL